MLILYIFFHFISTELENEYPDIAWIFEDHSNSTSLLECDASIRPLNECNENLSSIDTEYL